MKPLKPLERTKLKLNRLGRGEKAPNFDSMFDAREMPNPLDAETFIGEPEADAATEISAALKAILEQKRAMREVYRTTTDPEFWFAVCFQSREQKDDFLAATGWAALGDKYLDGLKVARLLDVPIEEIGIKPQGRKTTPVLLRTVQIIEKGGDD